jgi:glutathionyl-hydroquinone reductase
MQTSCELDGRNLTSRPWKHRELLLEKKKRLEEIIETVTKTIQSVKEELK